MALARNARNARLDSHELDRLDTHVQVGHMITVLSEETSTANH